MCHWTSFEYTIIGFLIAKTRVSIFSSVYLTLLTIHLKILFFFGNSTLVFTPLIIYAHYIDKLTKFLSQISYLSSRPIYPSPTVHLLPLEYFMSVLAALWLNSPSELSFSGSIIHPTQIWASFYLTILSLNNQIPVTIFTFLKFPWCNLPLHPILRS